MPACARSRRGSSRGGPPRDARIGKWTSPARSGGSSGPSRSCPRPPPPSPAPARARYLSVRHSHPPALVNRWLERHPRDVLTILVSGTSPPAIHLRVNRLRTDRDALAAALAAEGFPCEADEHPW